MASHESELPQDLYADIVELVTVKEFAHYRNVSERTVRQWIRERKVDADRVGERGHWRIRVRA